MDVAGESSRSAGLSPEDERYLWSNYDINARARIIEAYQPLVFHIFGKLGVSDRTAAVTVALQRGIMRLGK